MSTTTTKATTGSNKVIFEGLVYNKELKYISLFDSKWQKKYFRLFKNGTLAWFTSKNETVPTSVVVMTDATFQEYNGGQGKDECIKIIPKKKNSFCMAMMNPDEARFRKLKDSLLSVGAKEDKTTASSPKSIFASTHIFDQPLPTSASVRSKLEITDVEKWSVDDVLEWLNFLRDSDGARMSEKYGELFKDNDVDGKTLVTLNDQALKSLGISSLGKRVKLMREIDKLKKKRTYSLNEHLVMSKFEKMDPKYLKNVNNLEDKVQSLCDVEEILKTYLNTASMEPEELKKIAEDEKEDDEESFQLTQNHSLYNPNQQLKVKLIITEIAHTDSHKSFRKIVAPVVSSIPSLNHKFGIFHTALVVGPWFLEWTDSSLCIPKKISSSMALLTLDIDVITLSKYNLDSLARKLAEVVVDWNVNREYVNFKITGKRPEEGNCQDFVVSIFDKLEIQPTFKGALSTFLNDMRYKGNAELVFKPDAKFVEEFQLEKNTYEFHTHNELDSFVVKLSSKRPTFRIDYPDETTLLKSFDRAFWLRHLRKPNDEKYQPLGYGTDPVSGKDICSCPFDDPRKTETFYVK